ncbi:MAG TPA: hypothetical protein VES58_07455 [Syntrophobacteria bacterium]|nr:hypothetical protein [Syntrophobacteria bacterium]
MTDPLDKEQNINLEEAVISNAYEIAALITILERKGLVTRRELVEEVNVIKESLHGMVVTHK